MLPHKGAAGNELDLSPQGIVSYLSDETLTDMMGVCHSEPVEPEVCVFCAAYMELQAREDREKG